ncbi:hypothetical protein Smar_0305 [Staphylothermus marinus F1]|uniref:Uncharacterized protein n=1 Tax=Staphylothermus marinus (strain ATCC 43588 / DSM 3639 / JCM 9404 / F1) TaxID=399550 RepID=A3DLA8_STAMF|nr:hypothetical protein [Staphylothermus marinus]ABN69418.1 hypothetical protein Smar_0305 [Staphylothermus marinus F1]
MISLYLFIREYNIVLLVRVKLGLLKNNLNNKRDQAKTDLTSLINNVKQSLSSEHQEILSKLENLTHSTSKLSTEVNKNKQATTATNMGVAGTSLGAVALAAALFTLFKKK